MSGLRVALIDYGAGNLRSIGRALETAGAQPSTVRIPSEEPFDAIVLPGVGAFGAAMARLEAAELPAWIRRRAETGTPLIGICLGMQLLYDRSEESPGVEGLALLGGTVKRLPPLGKVPHMGWNRLHLVRPSPAAAGLDPAAHVYFVHSYVVEPADDRTVVATSSYGVEFPAIVAGAAVAGLQFHPEKSGAAGLAILRGVLSALVPSGVR